MRPAGWRCDRPTGGVGGVIAVSAQPTGEIGSRTTSGASPYGGLMTPASYAARRRPSAAHLAVGLGLGLVLLAGCGSGSDSSDASSAGSAMPSTRTSATAGATATPSGTAGGTGTAAPQPSSASPTAGPIPPKPSLSTEPGARARPQTVLGTVSVRQGDCLLFTPGDMAESWVLTGSTDGMQPGKGYTIEGAMDDQPNPACMHGPSFIVSSFTPAS